MAGFPLPATILAKARQLLLEAMVRLLLARAILIDTFARPILRRNRER
jgi:hypothetical protein